MFNKKLSISNKIALAILLSSTVAMTTYAVSHPKHKAPTKKGVEVLFVQTAKKADIQPINAKKGTFKLTLQDADPYVSFFSERPSRVTGVMPVNQYLNNWNTNNGESFRHSPPNLAVETMPAPNQGKSTHLHFMGTITNPQYNASKHTMSYTFKILSPATPALKNPKLGYTVLFIDSALVHWNPGGFGPGH